MSILRVSSRVDRPTWNEAHLNVDVQLDVAESVRALVLLRRHQPVALGRHAPPALDGLPDAGVAPQRHAFLQRVLRVHGEVALELLAQLGDLLLTSDLERRAARGGAEGGGGGDKKTKGGACAATR